MVTMSAVWDRTTQFLGEQSKAVLPIAVVTIFLPSVLVETLAPVKDAAAADVGLRIWLGLLALAAALFTIWGQLAIVALAVDPTLGAGAARARATARFLPFVAVSLTLLAAALLLFAPVLVILLASGVDLTTLGEAAATRTPLPPGAALAIAGYALILIPLVLWLVARGYVVTTAIVVAEDRMIGAIGRAWRLTRGLAARIVGVLVLFGIVMVVATLAATLVFGSIFRLVLGGEGLITAAGVLTVIVVSAVSTVFSVIAVVFPAKLYVALRDTPPPVRSLDLQP